MELVKPVEPVLWACIVELVMGGTGYGTVEALLSMRQNKLYIGFCKRFFLSSPILPWQHGTRQQGWYRVTALNMTRKGIIVPC